MVSLSPPNLIRAAPPLRSDIIFGRDNLSHATSRSLKNDQWDGYWSFHPAQGGSTLPYWTRHLCRRYRATGHDLWRVRAIPPRAHARIRAVESTDALALPG